MKSLETISFQIAEMSKDLRSLLDSMMRFEKQQTAFLIWQEQIKNRLSEGSNKMNDLQNQIHKQQIEFHDKIEENRRNIQKSYEQLHDHVTAVDVRTSEKETDKVYLRKDTIKLIAIGFTLASGATGAAIHLFLKSLGL